MTHPDRSEQQLRRALDTMNDLKPPTDELFVQRAVIRGRARTHRRRNALVGAAAALVVVAGGGGTWLLQGGFPSPSSPTAAGQAEDASGRDSDGGTELDGSGGVQTPAAAHDPGLMPPARDTGDWFVGPMTPQRAAFEQLVPELTTTWGATFSGAYATDATNSSLVVAVTRRDANFEQLVRGAMPDPSNAEFVETEHSYADKAALVERIWRDTATLESQGILISSVTQDYRTDRVAVAALGAEAEARLAERYGADWITVTVLGKAPEGTVSTPQR
jgi:hypothetical protein